MPETVRTLSNGLRVVIQHESVSMITHAALLICAGTRDEPEQKNGLAHFIEHNLFKGTIKRKSFHILNRLEVVGGELNAYTTKEETCVHASVMNQHFERALDLLADITLHPVFPEKEIEKEKEVVTDEIRSYQDVPYEQIFDDFEELLFKKHPLADPILGKEETIRNFSRSDLVDFTQNNYQFHNLVLAISSSIAEEKIIRLAEKYFDKDPRRSYKEKRKPRTGFKNTLRFSNTIKKPHNQFHYITGCVAPSFHHRDRVAMMLFNNLLGGQGMNSRLNLNIREKYGVTYTIESGYHAYSDAGTFHIYFATDARNFSRTQKLVEKELDKIRNVGIAEQAFKQYKEQLMGQLTLSQENRLSVLLSLAKSVMYFNKIITREEVKEKIRSVENNEIKKLAAQMLHPDKRSELIYQPELT